MVPSNARRGIRLGAGILDRHAVETVHALLLHRHAVQIALGPGAGTLGQTQGLARCAHALVLAHEGALALLALPPSEEQPAAVDGPVAEVTVARHAQRRGEATRRELGHELQHGDDLGVAFGAATGALLPCSALVLGGEGRCGGDASLRREGWCCSSGFRY